MINGYRITMYVGTTRSIMFDTIYVFEAIAFVDKTITVDALLIDIQSVYNRWIGIVVFDLHLFRR